MIAGAPVGTTPGASSRKAWLVRAVCRHPVAAVFVAALVVRVVLATVLSPATGYSASPRIPARTSISPSTGRAARGDPTGHHEAERFATYVVPVSLLFRPLHELLASLVAGVLAAIAAALTTRLAMEILNTDGHSPLAPRWRSSRRSWCGPRCRFGIRPSGRSQPDSGHDDVRGVLGPPRTSPPSARRSRSCCTSSGTSACALCIAAVALLLQAVLGPSTTRRDGRHRGRHRARGPLGSRCRSRRHRLHRGEGRHRGPRSERRGRGIRTRSAGRPGRGGRGGRGGRRTGARSVANRVARRDPPSRGLTVILVEPVPWTSLRGETVTAARFESPLWWGLVALSLCSIRTSGDVGASSAFPPSTPEGVVRPRSRRGELRNRVPPSRWTRLADGAARRGRGTWALGPAHPVSAGSEPRAPRWSPPARRRARSR